MKIKLSYHKNGLEVELPGENVRAVLRKPAAPALREPAEALADGLRNPIGSEPLSEIARGKRNAVIVVSDRTRPVPNRTLLPPIIKVLKDAGIAAADITIIVATGLHAPCEGPAIEQLLGPQITRRVKVVNHDGRDLKGHTRLGTTERGTPVHIDTRYVNAELKVLTGLIEPHFMAGFSGGPKAILPGLVAAQTIGAIHGYTMLADPRCRTGNIADNPLHEEMTTVARMAGADFLLNVTLNEAREMTGVFCGDVILAHRAGCESARRQYTTYVDDEVDIAVSSSAGFPLDTSFYQAAKGICTPLEIVRAGGIIITAAGCADGIGSPEYEQLLQQAGSFQGLRERISSAGTWLIDQWNAQMMLRASEKARLLFYTDGVSRQKLGRCLVEPLGSVEQGVEIGLDLFGPHASVAVIPEGPYVIAELRRAH